MMALLLRVPLVFGWLALPLRLAARVPLAPQAGGLSVQVQP